MPELPEVETIKLGLQKYLVGHTILDIELRLPKQFRGDPKKVIGGKVIGVRRFGKGLIIDLDNDFSLAIHVKMTGQLLYLARGGTTLGKVGDATGGPPMIARSKQSERGRRAGVRSGRTHARGAVDKELVLSRVPSHRVPPIQSEIRADGDPSIRATRSEVFLPDAHTHIVFSLDKGAVLYYRDMRQFGWVMAVATEEVLQIPFFKGLGPEPLKDLTFERFTNLVTKSKTPIKLLLMDQAKIAGIGNIYANDALYLAKIHPKRPASSLDTKESKELLEAIETVLQKGIKVGGASEWHYVDVLGEKGKYQNFFLVYRKHGTSCPRCGNIIEKLKLGGRGTFFCPTCQPQQ